MRKEQEVSNPNSCLNRAKSGEYVFTMLGRDPAAPVAIAAWIDERIRLGKNKEDDEQIREAKRAVLQMELDRLGPEQKEVIRTHKEVMRTYRVIVVVPKVEDEQVTGQKITEAFKSQAFPHFGLELTKEEEFEPKGSHIAKPQ